MRPSLRQKIQPAGIDLSGLYPYLALGVGLLGLGSAAIFVYLANAPGTIIAFYRTGIASILATLPFLRRTKQARDVSFKQGLPFAIAGGILFSLDVTFWSAGILLSGPTNPTLMVNTAPLWVGLGAWFIFRKRPGWTFWLGLIIALAGVALVLVNDLGQAAQVGLGTLLGLLAAIFYGGYFLVTERGRLFLSTISYFWITTISAFIFQLILNLVLKVPLSGYPLSTYLYLLALGVFVHFIGWLALNYAQGFLPATIVSPTLLGQPVLVAIFASLLLGSALSGQQIAGGLLVLAGIFIVYRGQKGI
ncbi:MAG: DMT family transporter [Anaerolineales bacterium]